MSQSLQTAFIDFIEYCELEKGLSYRTAEKYHYRLMRFYDWLVAEKAIAEPEISDITETNIKDFRLYLNRYESEQTKKNLAASTQQHYLVALRAFLKYLKYKKSFSLVAAEDILLPKPQGKTVTFLTPDQLADLFSQPDTREVAGLRDRAMLELFFSTGLRVQELVNLNRDSIPEKGSQFTILGKGNRYRVVFLSESSRDWIELYVSRRLDPWVPLFINAHGLKGHVSLAVEAKDKTKRSKGSRSDGNISDALDDPEGEKFRLTVRSVQRMIKKYARKAGLSVEVTPHVMRHSFATDLLTKGADLRSVQELLGHKNVATTQIYTHVTNKHLREIHEKFHSNIE